MTTLGTPLLSSPSTPNGRIEIYGQQGLCDGSGVTVDRAMPAVLTGRLTDAQWNQLCDDLDEALKPAAKMKKIFLAGFILIPILFITFVAIGISSTQKKFDNFPNNTSPHNDSLDFSGFIIGVVILFAGFCILMCAMDRNRNAISSGLRKVCDQYSTRLPGVSFHVRYESRLWGSRNSRNVSTTEYIEVSVAPSDTTNVVVEPPLAQAIPAPLPSAPLADDPEIALGGSGGEKKSPAERMRELDKMKGLLTDDEYQQKRAEILSDV